MATFHCNATGNPTPKIRWIKDGKTVGEEDTLSFVTKRNDSGRYWCLADNGFNATVKAIAYLNVQCEYIFAYVTICFRRQVGNDALIGNDASDRDKRREKFSDPAELCCFPIKIISFSVKIIKS